MLMEKSTDFYTKKIQFLWKFCICIFALRVSFFDFRSQLYFRSENVKNTFLTN